MITSVEAPLLIRLTFSLIVNCILFVFNTPRVYVGLFITSSSYLRKIV
jgi:hypothetical protein